MNPVIYRLTWFELQVCPFDFRLSVIPAQPVLVGYGAGPGRKAATVLVPFAGNENVVEWLVDSLDSAIRKTRIFETVTQAAHEAFTADRMKTSSLHVRAAYGDQRRWAAVYGLDQVPPNLRALVGECDRLGKEVIRRAKPTPIRPATGTAALSPPSGVVAPGPAAVVAKVKITGIGTIVLNGVPSRMEDVRMALARLSEEGGQLWYYRENPDDEPPEAADALVEAAAEHGLTIRLCEHDFASHSL